MYSFVAASTQSVLESQQHPLPPIEEKMEDNKLSVTLMMVLSDTDLAKNAGV